MQGTTHAERPSIESVLIVEDHPLYGDALAATVRRVFPESTVRVSGRLDEALAELDGGFSPDLVMCDLKLPDIQGISGFSSLKACLPNCPILVISALASQELVDAVLRAGATAYLAKDCATSELRQLLMDLASGRRFEATNLQVPPCAHSDEAGDDFNHPTLAQLTPQQKRVLRLICEGKPNKQIAFELDLAEATVKAHITALLRRLNVLNRTQAAVLVETFQAQEAGEQFEARQFLAN